MSVQASAWWLKRLFIIKYFKPHDLNSFESFTSGDAKLKTQTLKHVLQVRCASVFAKKKKTWACYKLYLLSKSECPLALKASKAGSKIRPDKQSCKEI